MLCVLSNPKLQDASGRAAKIQFDFLLSDVYYFYEFVFGVVWYIVSTFFSVLNGCKSWWFSTHVLFLDINQHDSLQPSYSFLFWPRHWNPYFLCLRRHHQRRFPLPSCYFFSSFFQSSRKRDFHDGLFFFFYPIMGGLTTLFSEFTKIRTRSVR